MCGYIQRINLQSQICCSSVVCNICRGYTEAAMELNRKWWWYCGTSISVPPPRVQMLHLRCGRLQWWEQLLCCELTGKTERMQKCQEREGERTSDRNKDWGPVKDCLCTSSARFISSTLLARRVKLSGIFTNKCSLRIKIGPLGPLGPQDWGRGKRKIVRAKNKSEQTGFAAAGWIGSEVAPGHTFRLLRGSFYSILIFKCISCRLVIRVPNNRAFYPETTRVRSAHSLVWNAPGLIDLTDLCFTTRMICNTSLFTHVTWSVLGILR